MSGAEGAGAALSPRRRSLVAVAVALAARDETALRDALEGASERAGREAVEEALLQSHLFLGFPAALEALRAWRERAGPPAEERDPLAGTESAAARVERGERVCRRVYGRRYEALRSSVRELHPALDRWMVREGYGAVLGRPGLDLASRELCICALLAVTGFERQLRSHLHGALAVGASTAEVSEALEAALGRVGPEGAEGVRALWERVRSRADPAPRDPGRTPDADGEARGTAS